MLDVGENIISSDKECLISWNGNDYPIKISAEKERKEGPQEFIDDGPAGTYVTGLSSEVTYTYKISCPKEYDGLCMCLIKPSALPDDAEQQSTRMHYSEDGTQITSVSDDGKDYNLFENEYRYGLDPSSDTLYMMRVDDMASKEIANATDQPADAGNLYAKGDKPKVVKQEAEPVQTTPTAASAPTAGHPLNLE